MWWRRQSRRRLTTRFTIHSAIGGEPGWRTEDVVSTKFCHHHHQHHQTSSYSSFFEVSWTFFILILCDCFLVMIIIVTLTPQQTTAIDWLNLRRRHLLYFFYWWSSSVIEIKILLFKIKNVNSAQIWSEKRCHLIYRVIVYNYRIDRQLTLIDMQMWIMLSGHYLRFCLLSWHSSKLPGWRRKQMTVHLIPVGWVKLKDRVTIGFRMNSFIYYSASDFGVIFKALTLNISSI